MTPTHSNKKGVRYRYYVSQAALRQPSAGPLGRVSAPELEATVVGAIRRYLEENVTDPLPDTDRELIKWHLLRVTLSTKAVMLHLRQDVADTDTAAGSDDAMAATAAPPKTLTIPWAVPAIAPVKGVVHVPAYNTPMKPGSRETLLVAIAKARRWIKKATQGQSFAEIARREGIAERHVRRLAPLAFVSPRLITAIIDGAAPAALTATALATGLPYSWAEQEQLSAK